MGPRGPPGPTGSPVSTSCTPKNSTNQGTPVDRILWLVTDRVHMAKSHNCNVMCNVHMLHCLLLCVFNNNIDLKMASTRANLRNKCIQQALSNNCLY